MRTILISLQQLSAFLQLRTNLYISEQTSTATIARAILIGGATSKTTRPPQLVAMHGRAGCLHRIHHISLFVWKVMRTPLKSLGVVISLRNTVFTEHEEQQTKNCLGCTIASILVSTNVSMMVSTNILADQSMSTKLVSQSIASSSTNSMYFFGNFGFGGSAVKAMVQWK